MAYTQYTGDDMVYTFDGITYTGIQEVTITVTGAEPARKLDDTVAGDAAYSEMTDPLGSQGDDHTTLTVTQMISKTDFTDTGILTKAIETSGTALFQPDGNTAGSDQWTDTMTMQRREYTIDLSERATLTTTFECNSAGTWSTI
jgi:hypothetical protein